MSDKSQWELEGRSLYALNANGYNRFLARVEPGQNDDGKRIPDAEVEDIARLMCAALDLLAALKETSEAVAEIMRWISETDIDHAYLYRLQNRMERFGDYAGRANAAIARAVPHA